MNEAIDWAYAQRVGKSSKAVLVALANHANRKTYNRDTQTARCWPGRLRLMEQTELSKDTVREAVRSLEGAGLIQSEPLRTTGGRRRGTQYTLFLGAGVQGARVYELRDRSGRSVGTERGERSAPNRRGETELNQGVPSVDEGGGELSAYDDLVKR